MVKPQFEVGKERVGKGGVVRDPALRAEAVRTVVADGGRRSRLGRAGGRRSARCRARRATSSSSCGCGAARPSSTGDEITEAVVSAGPPGVPGEKVEPSERPAAERAVRRVLLLAHTGRAEAREVARAARRRAHRARHPGPGCCADEAAALGSRPATASSSTDGRRPVRATASWSS